MPGRMHEKRCLIVGGTSGLGLAAAKRFAQEGAKLVAVGLPEYDASDATQVEKLFIDAVTTLGGLDVLYHVAGSSGRSLGDGPLHECTDAGWQATIDANLKSVFLTNRAAIGQFLSQGTGGVILNMASVLAFSPSPKHFDTSAYTAAKGGIIALSRLAASGYAADKIRVNIIAPGLIETPMSKRAVSDPAIVEFLKAKQPLSSGPGQPEDCADAAVFLCSDEARLITGVVLPVDGGWSVSN